MSKITKFALIFILVSSSYARMRNKVIYGDDDRQEVSTLKGEYKQWADATAAMVSKKRLSRGFFLFNLLGLTKNYKLRKTETLYDYQDLCSDERYARQITSSDCTGFLVGEDTLVTAGHCVTSEKDCKDNYWVFGYTQSQVTKHRRAKVQKKDVYKCSEIIAQHFSWEDDLDYAVIKLNKKVKGRKPLEMETDPANIKVGDELAIVGTPSGLPLKFSNGAKIRSVRDEFFSANLDSFGGNSGSPVISKSSGKVVGILVRGEPDYEMDMDYGCNRPYKCKDDECRGEEATLITELPKFDF